MLKKLIIPMICLLCLGSEWAGGRPAAAAWQEPWRLAVVVQTAARSEMDWVGRVGREVVQNALNMEMRSLPLRVSAGLWLATVDGVKASLAPAPSLDLKSRKVALPRGRGAPELAPALVQAAAWLAKSGGGSLVVLAWDAPQELAPMARAVAGDKVFCHVVGLANPRGRQTLADLALAGGGSFFVAPHPRRVASLLHRAVTLGLSPARLLVLAHDQNNRAMSVTYRLEQAGAQAVERRGRAGRPQQVLAGVYHLGWPAAMPPAPGPLPQRVSVADSGVTRLWAGGVGLIKVTGQGQGGRPLDWRMSLVREADGKVLAQERPPFQRRLPAGGYLVKAMDQPLAWAAELPAAGEVSITVGPRGKLLAKLQGPGGPARAAYRLTELTSGRPGGTGYTNSELVLKPGAYHLELEVTPGHSAEVTVPPAGRAELDLPTVAGVLTPTGPGLGGFTLMTPQALPLAMVPAGRVHLVMPGDYLAVFDGSPPLARRVRALAGQVSKVDPPSPGVR